MSVCRRPRHLSTGSAVNVDRAKAARCTATRSSTRSGPTTSTRRVTSLRRVAQITGQRRPRGHHRPNRGLHQERNAVPKRASTLTLCPSRMPAWGLRDRVPVPARVLRHGRPRGAIAIRIREALSTKPDCHGRGVDSPSPAGPGASVMDPRRHRHPRSPGCSWTGRPSCCHDDRSAMTASSWSTLGVDSSKRMSPSNPTTDSSAGLATERGRRPVGNDGGVVIGHCGRAGAVRPGGRRIRCEGGAAVPDAIAVRRAAQRDLKDRALEHRGFWETVHARASAGLRVRARSGCPPVG